MTTVQSAVKCGDCKKDLQEEEGSERKPCPYCGSLKRDFYIAIHDSITIRSKAKINKFTEGIKKARQETIVGDDLHRDSGEWRQLERNIDRENDRYTEIVVNSAGKVVHQTDELLSKHTGHGSARKKNVGI